MLLGEPSPSLAKIAAMNTAKLEEKITSLNLELERVTAKLSRLQGQDDPPLEKVKTVTELITRLTALKKVATKRLAEKKERKAAWEARQQQQGNPPQRPRE
jgi:chromosome segregation ATPase